MTENKRIYWSAFILIVIALLSNLAVLFKESRDEYQAQCSEFISPSNAIGENSIYEKFRGCSIFDNTYSILLHTADHSDDAILVTSNYPIDVYRWIDSRHIEIEVLSDSWDLATSVRGIDIKVVKPQPDKLKK